MLKFTLECLLLTALNKLIKRCWNYYVRKDADMSEHTIN